MYLHNSKTKIFFQLLLPTEHHCLPVRQILLCICDEICMQEIFLCSEILEALEVTWASFKRFWNMNLSSREGNEQLCHPYILGEILYFFEQFAWVTVAWERKGGVKSGCVLFSYSRDGIKCLRHSFKTWFQMQNHVPCSGLQVLIPLHQSIFCCSKISHYIF